jgi:hypothetical protein
VGHYCRICGRTRANEKFSGKGHKNHVCKDCSGKSGRKVKKNRLNENALAFETMLLLDAAPVQLESVKNHDNCFLEIDFGEENINDENAEELPF